MKIFLSFKFDAKSAWIEEHVRRLISAFGAECVTGRDMGGQLIPEEVRRRIASADALISFLTRDIQRGPDSWDPSDWVRDEYNYAVASGKKAIVVVESGVQYNAGIAGQDRLTLRFGDDNRHVLMVELAEAIGRWKRSGKKRFQLQPREALVPHLDNANFQCYYRKLRGHDETEPIPVPVRKIIGGLFIDAEISSDDSFIQVEVSTGNGKITSDYTQVDTVAITLPDR